MAKKKGRGKRQAAAMPADRGQDAVTAADSVAGGGPALPDEPDSGADVTTGGPAVIEAEPGSPAGATGQKGETAGVAAAGAGPDQTGSGVEQAAEPDADPTEVLRRERDLLRERWLRSVAELENFRKRAARELDDSRRFAVADLVRKLLEVLDNFERALQTLGTASESGQELQNTHRGVELIYQHLKEILTEQGLREIEALGAEFDPRLHEALGQVEKEGVPSGQITQVVQAGYLLDDLLLRPARVIIAQ